MKTTQKKFNTYYSKISNKTGRSDVSIYVEFCILISVSTPVNIWHIEQNMLKNVTNGRESIKNLCLSKYLEFFETTTW